MYHYFLILQEKSYHYNFYETTEFILILGLKCEKVYFLKVTKYGDVPVWKIQGEKSHDNPYRCYKDYD
jgi:hypothetical protein